MTTYTHLRQLFADIAIGALALQAGACSSSHDIDRAGFEETPCDTNAHLAAVAFASETDYLAIRRIVLDVEGNVDPQQTPQVESAVGVPCMGAPDPDACDAAFEALPLQPGFEQASFFERSHYQLLWTRGDEAGVVTNTAELQRFLGTIESPEQAALIVRFATGSRLACDGANTRVIDGGVEVITNSGTTCGEGTALYESLLRINADGTVTEVRTVVVEVGDPNCVIGRLTEGLAGPEGAQHADLGSYFSEMAKLEATAVVAFERLARELEALAAPASLVSRARQAAADETRHTEAVADLARRFGGESAPHTGHLHHLQGLPDAAELPLRGAFEIALENAVEGCVRETYGALVATYQASQACDERVRSTLAGIAEDETQHAALSWDMAQWLESVLSPEEVRQVRLRQAQALRLFRAPHDNGLAETLRAQAGLPSVAQAEALFAGLERRVWEPALPLRAAAC